jgi:nucleoside-triphosphatase THEP1/ABC-type thiamin/hydroxymethylpyrimidine transport system permease subunit
MNNSSTDMVSYVPSGVRGIYYRLIALWVLNEAMLGGIIHGLKIPVSGLIVGGCAVICICLIGWYVPKKGAILKATLIVAVFKMMLSPQAPPPAYIAVFFQGLMGELLFWNRRFFKLSCLLLAMLSLLESGLQRILVLTILYGNDLWKVINDFINGLTKQKTATNYSLLIGGGYVLLHLIAGLVVGWWASILPGRIAKWNKEEGNKIIISDDGRASLPVMVKRKKQLKKGLLIVWILLIVLYAQSYFKIGTPLLPSHISLKILLRSVIIVLSWYFIVGPLLKKLLHYWLQKKKTRSQQDVREVLQLLPATKELITQSWRRSANKKGWKRMTAAGKIILVNSLSPVIAERFFVLTGPIETGKTTSLVKWSEKRNDVFGILTPVVNGKRTFMNVHARHLFEMEATDNETGKLFVGRFIFSKAGFEKAIQIIRDSVHKEGWMVIDEIGPMELRGEGFCEAVKEIISSGNKRQKVLLVVREGLVDKVKNFFQINEAVVITGISGVE